MAADYLSPYIAGMFRSSANLTLRELGSKNLAQATIPSAGPASPWTFQLILPPRHSTSSCSTTVPPKPSELGTCHLSSPNHKRLNVYLINYRSRPSGPSGSKSADIAFVFFYGIPLEYESSRNGATQSLRRVLPWCLLGGTDHGRPAVLKRR